MENLFSNISSYDVFISKLTFLSKTIETLQEKLEYKILIHQTNVFFASLLKRNVIRGYNIDKDKSNICKLKNGILDLIYVEIDSDKTLKEADFKALFKLYNIQYKYFVADYNTRYVRIRWDFNKWLQDVLKE